MSSRRLTALLIVVTVSLVGVGIYGVVGNYSRVAGGSTIAIAGVVALVGIVGLLDRQSSPLEAALDQDQLLARRKSAVRPEEWFGFLEDAKSEFYIAGHSLGRWCDKTSHDDFTEQLARILRGGGEVTLIMLSPGSEQIPRLRAAINTDYSENVRRSHETLEAFIATLVPEHQARLTISLLDDRHYLPYMLVGNEQTLITATYLATRDSEEMPCLTLERESDAARAIYDDFHALAELGDPLGSTVGGRSVQPAAPPLSPDASSEQRRRLARKVLLNLKRLRSR